MLLYRKMRIISLQEMFIYRLLIHRFAVPLPSQGKAHEETQQTAKLKFAITMFPLFFLSFPHNPCNFL